jgi:hypothetical protein
LEVKTFSRVCRFPGIKPVLSNFANHFI